MTGPTGLGTTGATGPAGAAALLTFTLATRPITVNQVFYNSTLQVAEFYNGTYYQPENQIIVQHIIGYTPYKAITLATSGTGTQATVTWTPALPIAPSIGSLVTISGVTPIGYNGTWQVTASTTNSISFATVVTGAQTVAGTIATTDGLYIQLGGTPLVGTLNDIAVWTASTTSSLLAYPYIACPVTIQVGTLPGTFWRKGGGTWIIDGSLNTLPMSSPSDTVYPLVYNNTIGVIATVAIPVEFGAVLDNTLTTPPALPGIGDAYLVPHSGATDAWINFSDNVVTWTGSAWGNRAPVANAAVSIVSGINAGTVLIYTNGAWGAARTGALTLPQNAVTAPASVVGSLFEDLTNRVADVAIATSKLAPATPIQVIAIVTTPLTSSNPSGLYAQSAGTLPVLTTGSATIAYNDIFYWNASTLTAFAKYQYANCPTSLTVGTVAALTNTFVKNGNGGWVMVAGAGTTLVGDFELFNSTLTPAGNPAWLRQGTGPYLNSAYPALGAVWGIGASVTSTVFNTFGLGYISVMCYGNGTWIGFASSASTSYIYSTDSVNWTTKTFSSVTVTNAIWTGTNFVLVCASNILMISPNGVTWTQNTLPNTGSAYSGIDVNGQTICVTQVGSTSIARSADGGQTWTLITNAMPISATWMTVCFGNGTWVAQGGNTTYFAYSLDNGLTWVGVDTGASMRCQGIAYGNSLFVATVYAGSAGTYYTSPDGKVWTLRTWSVGGARNGIIWTGKYFLTGRNATAICDYSIDGLTWLSTTMPAATNGWSRYATDSVGTALSCGANTCTIKAIKDMFNVPTMTEPASGQYWVSAYSNAGASGTLANYSLAARPTSLWMPFYNTTLGVAEFYNGVTYQSQTQLILQHILGYTPFKATTTVCAGTGTVATVTWGSALPIAPTLGTWITIVGVTPIGYNGTWQITASSTLTVSFACTATGAQTVAGTVATTDGTYTQLGGIPLVGALADIASWTAATSTALVAYTFASAPETIQVGSGTGAAWARKAGGIWVLDGGGALASFSLANRPTAVFVPFYNTTLGVCEYTNGSFYQPQNPLVIRHILTYTPFKGTTSTASGSGTVVTVSWAPAVPIAPTVGSWITIAGVTPAGYNGTWQITASTSNSVSFANTTTGAQTVAGTVATMDGVYIQLAGIPVVGALKDIVTWTAANTTTLLAYTFANSPETIQVGVDVAATLARKLNGTWVCDGTPTASILDVATPTVYCVTDGLIETQAQIVDLGAVLDNTLMTPPVSPTIGATYLVPATGATGFWAPLANKVVTWSGSAWTSVAPVRNALVTVIAGTNSGATLGYSGTTWVATPSNMIVAPQVGVTTPPTMRGAIYEDGANRVIDVNVGESTPSALSYVQVVAILTRALVSNDVSGLYILTAGTLPSLMAGSAAIVLNDVLYWNATTATAWRKYAYAQAPAVIGVGTGTTIYMAAKFGGTWNSVGTGQGGDTAVGVITAFGGTIAPAGSLLCNGASYLQSAYPELFAVIGTAFGSADATHFNVPDLRGLFTRGVNAGTGRDPDVSSRTALITGGNIGDNIGSYQTDQFASHTHNMQLYYYDASTPLDQVRACFATSYKGVKATDATGGNETRPKNVYVNYIIKAFTNSANQSGAVVTPMATYTPTITNCGTLTNVNFFWQRRTDSIYIYGSFTVGLTIGAPLAISLPFGLTLNTTTWQSSTPMVCGFAGWSGDGVTAGRKYQVLAQTSDPINVYMAVMGGGFPDNLTIGNANAIAGAGQTIQVQFTVPISQWGGTSAGGLLTLMPVQTGNFTAIANAQYPVNTTSVAITATLPAVPTPSTQISFLDYARNFNGHNLTINFNGSNFTGQPNSYVISESGTNITLTYIDAVQGWLPSNYFKWLPTL